MEKEIVSIILKMLQTNLLKELYEKRATNYEFPPKLSVDKLPFNVVVDFNSMYFDKYKDILIENAIIFAIKNNDKIFTDFFTQNINNLTVTLDKEPLFKIKLSEYAIKHIINKHYNKTNNDIEIKNKYSKLFEKLNLNSIKIKSFTNLYREIIIKFVKDYYKNSEPIYIMDSFLNSTSLDDTFIKFSKGIINSKNILEYKNQLIRLILADVFVILENETKEEDEIEFDNYIDLDMTDEEFIDNIDKIMLNYIRESIKNNEFFLPQDEKTRLNLFAVFITHNSLVINRQIYIEALTVQKRLSLKKINPLYQLDLIDSENID